MTIAAGKPLMLKEYLQLDDDDDSDYTATSGIARVATTIRCLLDAELRCGGESLVPKERPGKKALSKFSAAIHAVKLLPFSSPDGWCHPSAPEGSLPRNFSERLRGSFWGKKKKQNERAARLKDIMRIRSAADANGGGWRSLRFPSPVASSRSSWSETDSSGSDFHPASMASSESPHSMTGPNKMQKLKRTAGEEESDGEAVDGGPGKESVGKGMKESAECSSAEEEEEEEQLSPVSVIDYPYQQGHGDDDENNIEEEAYSTSATSPAFYRSLGSIERTKEQLLNRIRRFEMLAAHLGPIGLQGCSPSSDAEEEDGEVMARGLLRELNSRPRGSVEKLLLDYFMQGQPRASDAHRDRPMRWGQARTSRAAGVEAAEMLDAARDWIDGRLCREADDDYGEATLREMDRNGRWRCFQEEEDLVVCVEVSLLESLLEETLQDLTQR